jgi:4-hydroxybenzoate polyprenyltransferase
LVSTSLFTAQQTAAVSDRPPLVVDLDGTLVRTDTLVECLVAAFRHPLRLLRALMAIRHGKARLKRELAALAELDPVLLPYNRELAAFLRDEQKAGRSLILATAADRRIALRVAQHLDLFDTVLASDGETNLAGPAKLAAIREALDGRPFVYAGNERHDLAVWREAEAAITVAAPQRVVREAAQFARLEGSISRDTKWPVALLRAMRPHQWIKNLLVFVPIVTARAIGDLHGWDEATLMFLAFSAVASGIYLVNDLCDLAADRQHPEKRSRALASGALPLHIGLLAAPLLIAAGLALAAAAGALPVLAVYAAMSLAYSLYFKAQPLADVFLLAGLYTIRLIGGGLAAGYRVSLWLLAFSSFLFLSLAIVKRVAELQELAKSEQRHAAGRGYRAEDARILELMGVAASFVTSLVLALYVQAEMSVGTRGPTLSWAIVPLMLFWQCRLWLATSRGRMHHDPIVFAARDWVSWLVTICSFGVLLLGDKIGIFSL